jgi:hypothetical protein
MRAFLIACLAALLLGFGAAYVLTYVPNAASTVFTTQSVRL